MTDEQPQPTDYGKEIIEYTNTRNKYIKGVEYGLHKEIITRAEARYQANKDGQGKLIDEDIEAIVSKYKSLKDTFLKDFYNVGSNTEADEIAKSRIERSIKIMTEDKLKEEITQYKSTSVNGTEISTFLNEKVLPLYALSARVDYKIKLENEDKLEDFIGYLKGKEAIYNAVKPPEQEMAKEHLDGERHDDFFIQIVELLIKDQIKLKQLEAASNEWERLTSQAPEEN